MSVSAEHKVPSTYQDWLECFACMRDASGADDQIFETASRGTFAGSAGTMSALQRQLVDTVNAFLDKSVRRFTRNLNTNIAFNELSQTDLLFKRLKRDVTRVLFFTQLSFLPEAFRAELEESVKTQMRGFWRDTIRFLDRQSMEYSNAELEDAIFLVKRIQLF